jgi:tetratricopeptide (TPR) repeat protein
MTESTRKSTAWGSSSGSLSARGAMPVDFSLQLGPKADDLAPQVSRADLPAPLEGADLDPREVLRVFGRAAAREPIEPDYDYLLGCALLRAGEPARAAERCAEAVRLHVLNPYYHFALGCALWRLSRYDEAEAAFREAARLQPSRPGARPRSGATLRRGAHQPGRCTGPSSAAATTATGRLPQRLRPARRPPAWPRTR